MPEACEPADIFLVVPSLYFAGEEKLRPEISLLSQAIILTFSAEFLQFCEELACFRLSVSSEEREKRASSKKASGRKKKGRAKGREAVGILTNITGHQLPRPLLEKPFFVSKCQEFKCQNAPSRRDRESSYSVTSHPHVIIWVGTGSIFFHPGGGAGVVDTGGGGGGYWYLISRGWHIMTS